MAYLGIKKREDLDSLSKIIKRVERLGIHVILDGREPTAKALTIVIADGAEGLHQYEFKTLGEDSHNVESISSPFTWVMDTHAFVKWAETATRGTYALINRALANVVRAMSEDDFDVIRRVKNLEGECIKYLRRDCLQNEIPLKGLTPGAMLHLSMIYGGILHRERGIERMIWDLLSMAVIGNYIPDCCRTCRYCRFVNEATGRYCKSDIREPFPVEVGGEQYPDLFSRKGTVMTRYITGHITKCGGSIRRL